MGRGFFYRPEECQAGGSKLGEQPKTGDVPGAAISGMFFCCCVWLCGSVRTQGAWQALVQLLLCLHPGLHQGTECSPAADVSFFTCADGFLQGF